MFYKELIGLKLSHMNLVGGAIKLTFLGNNKKIIVESEDCVAFNFSFDKIPIIHLVIQKSGSFPFDISLRLNNHEYSSYDELLLFDNDKNIYFRAVAKSFILNETLI